MNDRPLQHLDDDQLINLASGLLSGDEKDRCLSHLKGCPSCEKQFLSAVGQREDLRAGGNPEVVGDEVVIKKRRSAGDGTNVEELGIAGKRRRAPLGLVGAVALVAVVLFVLLIPKIQQSPSDPLEYWLPMDRAEALLRSDPLPDPESNFFLALEAYRDGDAKRALALFEQTTVPESYEPVRTLFLASCLALGERYADAELELEVLEIRTLPEPERRRAKWILYIVLRKQGKDTRADQLLEELGNARADIGVRVKEEKSRREKR